MENRGRDPEVMRVLVIFFLSGLVFTGVVGILVLKLLDGAGLIAD